MSKKLAVTMGDPAGVGPELCLFLEPYVQDVIVYGHREILEHVAELLGKKIPAGLDIVEMDFPAPSFIPGCVSDQTGEAAYRYLIKGIEAAQCDDVQGVVTCPIHKEALNSAGYNYPGHTEILVEKTASQRHAMMLTSEEVTCSLVTTHIALREISEALYAGGVNRIVEVMRLTELALEKLRGCAPRLGVLGLNPHAGEGGLFGDEEKRLIEPAIKKFQAESQAIVEGPFPPDTAFLPAIRKRIDGYICLYHDQGLIPLKTLAFDEAVNLTLGLPFMRSSVDHGTALDIAWTGQVNPKSFLESVRLGKLLV